MDKNRPFLNTLLYEIVLNDIRNGLEQGGDDTEMQLGRKLG